MGTDIHLFVETQDDTGVWHRALPPHPMDSWAAERVAKRPDDPWAKMYARETWYNDRNYRLFAILADVRNGRGFAGVLTGAGFNPISPPRGLPNDLSSEVRACFSGSYSDDENPRLWGGDHSFSWLTLAEIFAFDWEQRTLSCGVIPWDAYLKRNPSDGEPKSYSDGVSGFGIVTFNEGDVNPFNPPKVPVDKLYVRVWWGHTYREAVGSLWFDVLAEMEKLGPPERTRIVFGFDS